ncbi:MAG: TIGR03032 family protein [Pirellulaceae bacterium]|nr:TIGR03032 family protein [Pirellulaceae bacterium]
MNSTAAATIAPRNDGQREVCYEHSSDLAELLDSLKATLLISTYQAGKLVLIGSCQHRLVLSFHNFDRPMGVAIDDAGETMAVAAKDKVWFLRNVRDVAPRIEPAGTHEACWLTRSARLTGEIQAHEMAFADGELWIVNTLFSCLCTLSANYSFVPRWRPPFVTALAPEDRCHLNGLAMAGEKPKYATAMAESDSPQGWRPKKAETGCLIDVETNQIVTRGFAMPHSPCIHQGHVWLLDSGRGALVHVDPADGHVDTVARFPGYVRGLAMVGELAFVGLSKIRETSTFGGVPIAEDRERLKCGVGIVNWRTGQLVGQFAFSSGVDEIFDVTLVAEARLAAMRGPFAMDEGQPTIWMVPEPNDT